MVAKIMQLKFNDALCKMAMLFCASLCVFACSTPGTYMGHEDMRRPYHANGISTFPCFVPITPALFCDMRLHEEYRVGPQDILTIIVWNHPELTIPSMQTTSENVNIYTSLNQSSNNPPGILINESGTIFFPLAGKLHVTHATVDEIRSDLTARLRKYIRNPQVSVRVSAFRNKPVYVIGEVMKNGVQYITDSPLTILDAINQAGGIDRETADTHYIYVIRGDLRHPYVYWLNASSPTALLMAAHFKLESRDVLMVSTAGVARYARLINRLLPTISTLTNQPIQYRN